MLYKTTPMGYFSRVSQTSRGPWFRRPLVEDDGLEWYYSFRNQMSGDGKKIFICSSNIPLADRQAFDRVYKEYLRTMLMCKIAGLYGSFEMVARVPFFKKMAIGWRVTSFLVGSWALRRVAAAYVAPDY